MRETYQKMSDFALLNTLQSELEQMESIKKELGSFGYTLSSQQLQKISLLKSLIKIYEDETGAKKSHE